MPASKGSTKDISATDGAKLVIEAASWKGTPYQFVGAGSKRWAPSSRHPHRGARWDGQPLTIGQYAR